MSDAIRTVVAIIAAAAAVTYLVAAWLGPALIFVVGAAAVVGPIWHAWRTVTGPLVPGPPAVQLAAAGLGVFVLHLQHGGRAAVGAVLLGCLSWGVFTHSRYFHRLRARRLAFESVSRKVGAGDDAVIRRWLRVRKGDGAKPGRVELSYDPSAVRAHDPKVRRDIERALGHRFGCELAGEWPASSTRALLVPVEPVPAYAELTADLVADLPDGTLAVAVGRGERLVTVNLDEEPQTLIAGKTGGGKSVTLRSLAWQASRWAAVVLLDNKRDDFRDMPAEMRRVSTFPAIVEAVAFARAEVDRRYEALDAGRHLTVERLVLICDEGSTLKARAMEAAAADRAMRGAHPVLTQLGEITRLGRAVGVHVIVALQRPDTALMPAAASGAGAGVGGGEMRDNMSTRIACGRLLSSEAAAMVFSNPDAAHAALELPDVRGRAVVEIDGEWCEAQLLKPARGLIAGSGAVSIDLKPRRPPATT